MSLPTVTVSTSGTQYYDVTAGTGVSQLVYNSGGALYTVAEVSAANYWVLQSGWTPPSNAITLDFLNGVGVQTVSITGNTSFTGVNYLPGHAITVRLLPPASGFNLSFSSGWSFVGSAAPTTIASGQVGILSCQCFTSSDVGTVCAYAAGTYSTA